MGVVKKIEILFLINLPMLDLYESEKCIFENFVCVCGVVNTIIQERDKEMNFGIWPLN